LVVVIFHKLKQNGKGDDDDDDAVHKLRGQSSQSADCQTNIMQVQILMTCSMKNEIRL